MAEVLQGITYARERLSAELAAEVFPLLEQHFKEIDAFQDEPLAPDWDKYYRAQASDLIRIYIARDASKKLLGYSVSFVDTDLHHCTRKCARADVFYIDPTRRGFGFDFLLWCNEQLQAEGVKVDFQHISTVFDWGTMARRAGYEPVENVWAKVL